jgi:hypothetical protein
MGPRRGVFFVADAVAVAAAWAGTTGAGAAVRTTAPSQELPPLSALGVFSERPGVGEPGTPTVRWKFPARDNSSTNWVTLDDTALRLGRLDPPGDPFGADASFWAYTPGIARPDSSSTGPGWVLFFSSNYCGGTNWWVIYGGAPCSFGTWGAIMAHLDALPGLWVPVGPGFNACSVGMRIWGGVCLARFIPAEDMSQYVRPITEVQVYAGRPWDVGCPQNPSLVCWGSSPPPSGLDVLVSATATSPSLPVGSTSDGFDVTVTNRTASRCSSPPSRPRCRTASRTCPARRRAS